MTQEHHKKERNIYGFIPLRENVQLGNTDYTPPIPGTYVDGSGQHFFTTKDSGKRVDYTSGMRRDVQEGKPRYDLIDRPYLKRLAELYARGADKYGDNNWQLANSEEELKRFESSAFRHLMQYLEGDRSEDHACAVTFNLAAAEHVRSKLKK